ncbi:MAG: sigma-70 family RNA polymerase sigma factor [Anaerolineae bacterium]
MENESPTLMLLSQSEFGQTVEQYRAELQAHCYRMFGSVQDAEDMVQETFLRAWKRRETYIDDTSLRAWLYKIATNICLDTLKKQRRRVIPQTWEAVRDGTDPVPAAILEPIWIEPYPDEMLTGHDLHPEQQVLAQETISIAFLAALQRLPPRQRAVLLLTDVLDWRAREVADLLSITVPAVKSLLHRARAKMADDNAPAVTNPGAQMEQVGDLKARLAAYVLAWETADMDALINLLTEDATFSMPPIPSWYQGRRSILALISRTVFSGEAAGRWRLLPTRANGQVAFGLYRQGEDGSYQPYGIQVLTLRGDFISDIITFRKPELVHYFRLPTYL